MRTILLMVLGLSWGLLGMAQGPVLPLREKNVAVYLSKKNFEHNRLFYHEISQFLFCDYGEERTIEDIKLEVSIAIGRLFSEQLAEHTEAKSTFFLNGRPELAREFMAHYNPDAHTLRPMGTAAQDVDYVLVVNPMILTMERNPVVLTRSNRLVTHYDLIRNGRVRLELLDPKSGALVSQTIVCVREGETFIPAQLFDFHAKEAKMGKFWGNLFSLAINNLNIGESGNCPVVEEEVFEN